MVKNGETGFGRREVRVVFITNSRKDRTVNIRIHYYEVVIKYLAIMTNQW